MAKGKYMKRTHEQFVKDVELKNPNVEILGAFEKVENKIQVKCKICGHIWNAKASHLLEGQGCPKCARERSRKNQAKSQQEFVEEISIKHPTIEVMGQYVNAFTPIKLRCEVCGNEWETKPTNLTRGHGCPMCAKNKSKLTSKRLRTHEEYVKGVQKSKPYIEVVSKYKASKGKVKCRCQKCGSVWETRADTVVVRGCPNCDSERTTQLKKPHKDFLHELYQSNPNISVLGQYESMDKKILVQCSICGCQWTPTPYNLLCGHGCPACALKKSGELQTKAQKEFEHDVSLFNPTIKVIGKYQGNKNKVKVKCLVCNNEWMANPSHLIKDRGCPKCSEYLQTSFPEQSLHYYISKICPDAINGYKTFGKNFDIYIPSLRTAIEYDGAMWHRNLNKDLEKNKLCEQNGVRLIRIRESGLPSLDGSINIERKRNHSDKDLALCIQKTVKALTPGKEIDINIDRDRNTIRSLYLKSESITDTVQKQLDDIGSDWELVDYQGTQVPVRVKCKKCGVEANKSIYVLLNGDQCSRCKREAEFLQKMSKVNSSIRIVGRYERSEEKIEVECMVCGQHWFMTPHYLLKGGKCPNFRKHSI